MAVAKLHSGADMPLVGLGTWQAPAGEVGNAVRAAVEVGYRHIDCAAVYGNEAEIGAVFADMFASGKVKREDLFVTSKLWNSEHRPENVESAVRTTLKDLQLEYLDLYLMHWPQQFEKVEGTNRGFPRNEDQSIRYDQVPLAETWAAMEKLVEQGLVRAIGLSNFNSVQIKAIHEGAKIKPHVLQCESHPFFPNEPLFALARSLGIVCTAYSPLGSGAEIDGYTVANHPELKKVADRHGKSAAQVACAWQLQRGNVVIPKSVSKERIAQNFDVTFALSAEDMAAIAALDGGLRCGWGGPKVERDGKSVPRDLLHADYPFVEGLEF
eukprot:TRINITY_DN2967_c0_g2_i1.p1 TRINITY_DN2967_c0_g2~~TRINITY_DN2967_c0_g2_i1.p1  ORF type:complete len:344 (+),score=127.52 TRINITY_DN2967_c0_g2_i1:58-1032(+)